MENELVDIETLVPRIKEVATEMHGDDFLQVYGKELWEKTEREMMLLAIFRVDKTRLTHFELRHIYVCNCPIPVLDVRLNGITTAQGYWTCLCEKTHRTWDKPHCEVCKAHHDESPDADIEDVLALPDLPILHRVFIQGFRKALE